MTDDAREHDRARAALMRAAEIEDPAEWFVVEEALRLAREDVTGPRPPLRESVETALAAAAVGHVEGSRAICRALEPWLSTTSDSVPLDGDVAARWAILCDLDRAAAVLPSETVRQLAKAVLDDDDHLARTVLRALLRRDPELAAKLDGLLAEAASPVGRTMRSYLHPRTRQRTPERRPDETKRRPDVWHIAFAVVAVAIAIAAAVIVLGRPR